MTNYYLLCQRKIRKIGNRIKLCEKHLDPTKETKEVIKRNEIRITKNQTLLNVWGDRLQVLQEKGKQLA
jgi:hypothetical protein